MPKFCFLAMLLLAIQPVCAAATGDSRPLTAAEQRAFFPLVCLRAKHGDKDHNCTGIRGYVSETPVRGDTSLSLDAIAYGAFTRAGAAEAYVTYSADFEPHASNFGGGILFARAATGWRLVRWYSGGQMDHCLALPVGGSAAQMLCLTGWTGQGETDSSVWVHRVPGDIADGAFARAATAVLKAQDDREAGLEEPAGNYQCGLKRRPGEAILLSIDDLTRVGAPGVFAQSHVTYAAAPDARAACRAHAFAHVRETRGIVRYVIADGRVAARTPVPFARTDY